MRGAVPVVVAVTHLLAAKELDGETARSHQMSELIDRLETFQVICACRCFCMDVHVDARSIKRSLLPYN